MKELAITGVPRCLMTEGWWLDDAPGQGGAAGLATTGPKARRRWTLLLLVALVLWADILFWKHPVGLSVALFALGLMAASALSFHPGRKPALSWAVGLACLAPVVENVSTLSLLFAVAAILGFAALRILPPPAVAPGLTEALGRVARALACASARAALDAGGGARHALPVRGFASAWALPCAAGLLFLMLFADANPILSDLLSRTIALDWLTGETVVRMAFWAILAYLSWPFLDLGRIAPTGTPAASGAALPWTRPALINGASVSNSLMTFNLMFALQTLSDILYLWSGASLPAGMTLAQYAHRGAYPLVLTALLAGLFALLTRPLIEGNRRLLLLLGLWLGQNGLLVASALYRLDLYVDHYGLTYLRVAAFIWMGLVAAGLVLIFVQIGARKDSRWLVGRVATVAIATVYACCFINFADMIARKNITLALEGAHPSLDCRYLNTLGPGALPAIRDHLVVVDLHCPASLVPVPRDMGWRDWGFRFWRIDRY